MRALESRQREIDAGILGAVEEVAAQARAAQAAAGPLHLAGTLPAAGVSEQETVIGTFWLRDDDTLVAPAIRRNRAYDHELSELMRERLGRGATFVDVGANIGYFSVLGSFLVGPAGRVLSVEPDPMNVRVLRANLWRNRCDNAVVIPLAAWSHPTHLNLLTSPDGGAATEVHLTSTGERMVPAAALDDLIDGSVDMLKIDAQMTDHHAIAGAERIIERSPSALVLAEFFPAALEQRGEDPMAILARYLALGLDLHVIDRSKPGGLEAATPADVLAACDNPDFPFCEVVLARP